jgi:hypothetical protein
MHWKRQRQTLLLEATFSAWRYSRPERLGICCSYVYIIKSNKNAVIICS